jgi:hypothetical protein
MPCRPRPEVEEAAATPLDSRYYLRWGGGVLGVLAILRFPMDARHPVAQQPYGAYAVGDVFPLTKIFQSPPRCRALVPFDVRHARTILLDDTAV